MERLREHVKGSLFVPGEKNGTCVSVGILTGGGSDVPAISKTLGEKVQAKISGAQRVRPFDGQAKVITASEAEQGVVKGKTYPLHQTLGT